MSQSRMVQRLDGVAASKPCPREDVVGLHCPIVQQVSNECPQPNHKVTDRKEDARSEDVL